MLFSLVVLVLPPGGDGSKIARFGEWQNGEGDYFHNLTVALPQSPPALALRVGFGGDWRQCVVHSH